MTRYREDPAETRCTCEPDDYGGPDPLCPEHGNKETRTVSVNDRQLELPVDKPMWTGNFPEDF